MQEQEAIQRTKAVTWLFGALSRPVSDTQIAAIVSATTRIPYRWLAAAVKELGRTWDESQRHPGARAIYAVAIRLAGFRAQYRAAVDPIDPDPIGILWWPRHPLRVRGELAECWDQTPQRLGLPDGQVTMVPRLEPQRRKVVQLEPRTGAMGPLCDVLGDIVR